MEIKKKDWEKKERKIVRGTIRKLESSRQIGKTETTGTKTEYNGRAEK